VLFLTQHPIRGLGKMTGDGDRRTSMSFRRKEPVIKKADMLIAMSFQANRAIGRFDKGPLEIVVTLRQVPPCRTCPPLAMTRGTSPA